MIKTPDWERDRYWGELVKFECPALYGAPVYYTDGTRIPYKFLIPEMAELTAEDLIK